MNALNLDWQSILVRAVSHSYEYVFELKVLPSDKILEVEPNMKNKDEKERSGEDDSERIKLFVIVYDYDPELSKTEILVYSFIYNLQNIYKLSIKNKW